MSVRELKHVRSSGRFSKSRGLSANVSFLSSPPPPSSFTCAICRAVFHSHSSFFAPKPHRNGCYADYSHKVKSIPKESSASRVLDPTFPISKTLQQRNTIPKSAGTKKLKATSTLKQRREIFQFGGKDKLNLKLTVFFTSPWLTIIRLARLIFFLLFLSICNCFMCFSFTSTVMNILACVQPPLSQK